MDKTIVWRGPLFDPSGYGTAGRGYVFAMLEAGLPIKTVVQNFTVPNECEEEDITSISVEDFRRIQETRLESKMEPEEIIFVDHNTPNILNGIEDSHKNVGYSVWETDRISKDSAERCSACDEIWTASDYSRNAFLNAGIDAEKVFVIPHVCDGRVFHSDVEPMNIVNKREFNFFTNFEFHKRKGYDVLIPAFLQEFKGNKDVALVVKTYNLARLIKTSLFMKKYIESLRTKLDISKEESPPIIVLDRRISFEILPRLYTGMQAYISTSRGEAWNLPVSEATMCGLPVIAPSIGGHTEFLSEDMYTAIPSEMAEISDEDIDSERRVYELGMRWVEPSIGGTREALRSVYENHADATVKAEVARQHVLEKFSPKKIASLIEERATDG